MRVLLAIEASGGGSGRHVLDLAAGLGRCGHAVTVVFSPRRAEPQFAPALAAVLPGGALTLPMRRGVGPWDLAAVRGMRRVLRTHGPFDIVHGHSSKAGAIVRLAAAGAAGGPARVYTPHGLRTMQPGSRTMLRFYGAVERWLASTRTDALIVVSRFERDHALALGVDPSRVHLVVSGITSAMPVAGRAVRRAIGVVSDAVVVGSVGRFNENKDPVRFLEAVAIARRSCPALAGVMVGSGELLDLVHSTRHRLGLDSSVVLVDSPRGRDIMSAFDVLCLTSRSEAMPYVLLEAIGNGLPVVTTAVGGAGEAVVNGSNGCIVPVDASPARLAEELVALARSTELRASMSMASRRRAKDRTVPVMVEETLRVYAAAIEARR